MPKLRLYPKVDQIKRELTLRGWSQLDLAAKTGFDQSRVSSILAGKHCGQITAQKVCRAFYGTEGSAAQASVSQLFSLEPQLYMTDAIERLVVDALSSFVFIVNSQHQHHGHLWAVLLVTPSKLDLFRELCVSERLFKEIDYFQAHVGKVLGAGYGELPSDDDLESIRKAAGLTVDLQELKRQLVHLDTNNLDDFKREIKRRIMNMVEPPSGYNPILIEPENRRGPQS